MEHNQILLDIEAETSGLYIAQPNSVATLFVLGGFIQSSKGEAPQYSWGKHREWVITNSNHRVGANRPVYTGWEYQVYVASAAHARKNRSERSYVCNTSVPFADKQGSLTLRKGFICAGSPGNNSYYTAFRPEDKEAKSVDLMREETFGVKLYFFDETRFRRNKFASGQTDVMLSARVRDDEILGFRSIVRTNAVYIGGHAAFTLCDISYRGYEKDMNGWRVERWGPDSFRQSQNSQEILINEAKYHNSIHLLIYQLITKAGE